MIAKRAGLHWTEDETADLIRRLDAGETLHQIAASLDRNFSGIDTYVRQLRRMGKITASRRPGVHTVQVSNTMNSHSTGRTTVPISMPRAPWEEAT